MSKEKNIFLIHKKLTEGLSPSEYAEHKAWLDADIDHKEVEADIDFAWNQSLSYKPDVVFDSKEAFSKFKFKKDSLEKGVDSKNKNKKSKVVNFPIKRWVYGLTACVIFGLVSISLFDTQESFSTQYVASSDKIEVLLEDETNVVLSHGASLDVANDFGKENRETFLEGKAYFKVHRDEQKPFIINTINGSVEVLGTAFNLSSMDSEILLEVQEGVVAFEKGNIREIVKAGEYLYYDGKTLELQKAKIASNTVFNWTIDNLQFINQNLTQVFAELSEYFEVDFDYSKKKISEAILNCPPITITKVKPDLKEIMEVLKEISGVEYQIFEKDRKVKISELGCF